MIVFQLHCACNHCGSCWQLTQQEDLNRPWHCQQCQQPIAPEICEDLTTSLQDLCIMLERIEPAIRMEAVLRTSAQATPATEQMRQQLLHMCD